MNRQKMEFRAGRDCFAISNDIEIALVVFDGNRVGYAEPAVIRMRTEQDEVDGRHVQPLVRISLDAAQSLIDELWRVGLRPTEGTGSAGAMEAQRRHLEDMRTLAFEEFFKSKKGAS